MALLPVDGSKSDGGLAKLVTDAKIPQVAIQWLTGSGANHMGIEGLSDFINSFTSKGFESEIDARLKEAQIEALVSDARLMNQAVARIRHAYKSAPAAQPPGTVAQSSTQRLHG